MGFTRRKLASNKAIGDRDLIVGYIQGKISIDELEAKDNFFWLAMTTRDTKLGTVAHQLWQELGPTVLRRCRKDIPDHIESMIHAHEWPEGSYPLQKKLLERQQKAQIDGLKRILHIKKDSK